jgi:tetratricopeptide (TPR) repeat protein
MGQLANRNSHFGSLREMDMRKLSVCTIMLTSFVGSPAAFADTERDCLLVEGDRGIAACSAAIALKPNVRKNFVYRSAKYSDAGLFDLAFADAKRALELDPKSGGAHAVLAKALSGSKKFDAAIVEASRAIELEPTMSGGYLERALALLAKQQFDPAIADLSKVIGLQPLMATPSARAEAYVLRAAAHTCLGAFDLAISDASQALQRVPLSAKALDVRAAAFSAKGDSERAIADQRAAASIRASITNSASSLINLCPAS